MLIFHLLATSFSKKAKSDIYWQKCSLAISVGFKMNAMFPTFFILTLPLTLTQYGNNAPMILETSPPMIQGTMPLLYWEQIPLFESDAKLHLCNFLNLPNIYHLVNLITFLALMT